MLQACAASPPRIVAIAPTRDAKEVAANQEIRITFDRAMDRAAVEGHFDLKPPLVGCTDAARCRFVWTNETMVFVHPGVNFALATAYTVFLHAGYADSRGSRNNLEHSWSFLTESPPALERVDPADRANGVAPERNIILSFSHQMDASTMRGAIALTPETPFVLRRRPGDDALQFEVIPLALLQPNTTYTLSVEGARDRHQNLMLGRVQSRFTTGPMTLSRRLGYLVGQRGQPPFGVAVVEPRPDAFLGQATPKLVYMLTDSDRATQALLRFDWAPDANRLLVIRAPRGSTEGRLVVVAVRSGLVQDLGIDGSDASWSPDGSSIVYLSRGDLHRYRLDRQVDVPLTNDGLARTPFSFSPDGKSVAYASDDATGAPHLWILNLELRARTRPLGLTDPADRPAWSPDGQRIAFRRLTAGGPQLWVYDLAGTYQKAAPLDVSSIAWLNDNSTVIVGVGGRSDSTLYRVSIFAPSESGGLVKVTGTRDAPNGSSPSAPVYDRRVGFTGIRDGIPQIFVMNADGSRPQQLTNWEADFPYTGDAPAWSPAA